MLEKNRMLLKSGKKEREKRAGKLVILPIITL